MVRFAALFAALLLVGFVLLALPVATEQFVEPFTAGLAHVSVGLIRLFDSQALAQGAVLSNAQTGFAVEIRPGCDGLDATLVLCAAVLAYPASWRARVIGIAVGIPAIQALNLLRIISLFYLGQWSDALFEFAHLYLWPTLIMLDAFVVFLIWIRLQGRAHVARQ